MKIQRNSSTKAIIPELRGNLKAIRYPCFAEIKWDGEACLISYAKEREIQILSTNKYGTMRYDWSKLDEIKTILEDKGVTIGMFLGEIFYGDGKAGALYKLLSNKDNNDLNIRIYDVVHIYYDGIEMIGAETALIDRKEILTELFNETPFHIQPCVMNCKADVDVFAETKMNEGYEGIVVKNFDGRMIIGPCDWVKIKNKDQTDYRIHSIDSTKDRMEIEVPNPANNDIVIVGVRVTTKQKQGLKVGDVVTIEHQGILDSGSLRHPVFIGKAKGEV